MKPIMSQGAEDAITGELFERTPVGMVVTSTKNVLIRVNSAVCSFLGYSKQELLGKTVRVITHPADWAESKRRMRQMWAGGAFTRRFEERYVHKNGKTLWGDVSVFTTCDERGKPQFSIAQILDITERKKVEERLRLANERFRKTADQFRTLAENSPDIIDRFDREFHHLYVNPAGLRILGLPAEKVIGKTIRETGLVEPFSSMWEQRIRKVFKTGRPLDVTDTFPAKEGIQVFESRCVPEFNLKGRVEAVLAISRDITRRKQLESALQQANEELEQKVKDRTSQLRKLAEELTAAEHQERRRIADILHEQLQQHLCGMKFRAIALNERISDPASIGQANLLVNELDQAIHMTRTLTTDIYPPVLSHLGIRDAIEWLATDMMKKLDLKVGVTTDKRIELRCDAMRVFVFEAVRELLLNVSKHAKVKTAEIRADSTAKGLVRIQVRDEGVGFDPKRNSGTNSHFGLFRIQERAEGFGGRLEVSSQPNKGTCVSIILPLGQERS